MPNQSHRAVLVIDDDRELCTLIGEFLEQHGFQAKAAYDGPSGLRLAVEEPFDLILLDVMLPGMDGFTVLAELRKQSDAPVLMLTARAETASRVAGLEAGADDYLPKPFDPDELLARMRAILRRAAMTGNKRPCGVLQVSGVRLEPATRKVFHGGREVPLTSVEFDVLETLMRAAGRVVSRDEIFLRLFQRKASPFDRSLEVHVSHIRKKLGRAELIRTVRGVGYQFAAEPAEARQP